MKKVITKVLQVIIHAFVWLLRACGLINKPALSYCSRCRWKTVEGCTKCRDCVRTLSEHGIYSKPSQYVKEHK